MKLILTFCLLLLLPTIYPKIFPLHQLKTKNYLHRKPVLVTVSSSNQNFTFSSHISRNSRGLLLEILKEDPAKKDPTGFFKHAVIPNSDQKYPQVLLDFRLISLCRFANKTPSKHAKSVSFDFDISNRGSKSTQLFKVRVQFLDLVRRELLVNDVHEFRQMLKQVRNACQTRKNQLKSRRDWFNAKADDVYKSVLKMNNAQQLRDTLLNPNNPNSLDNKIALAVKKHKDVALQLTALKNKARTVATNIGGLEGQALQIEKDRADDNRALSYAQRELENAKLQQDQAKIEFTKTEKSLLRAVPEAGKLVREAYKAGDQKDHQQEILKLEVNS